MVEKLSKLHNTLSLISTRGNDTKLMGDCLHFLEAMISEEIRKEGPKESKDTEVATE